MFKKITAVTLAALLLSFAVGCDSLSTVPHDTEADTQTPATESETQAPPADTILSESQAESEVEARPETAPSDDGADTVAPEAEETRPALETELETEAESELETEAETKTPEVVVSASSRLVVDSAAYQRSHNNRNITELKKRITDKVGLTLTVSRVSDTPDSLRDGSLIVGDTQCEETKTVKATLPANSYTVTVINKKVVILGSNESLTTYAMAAFCELVLTSEMIVDGRIRIPADFSYTRTLDAPLTLTQMLADGMSVEAVRSHVLKADPVGDCNIAQGAASDGTYAYLALRNADDTAAVIVKVNMADGKTVAVSEKLALGHANDMTYNTKTKQLVVVHGQDEGKIVTLVNPETLTVIEDVTISKKAGAITYNPETNTYAIGRGGTKLHFLDADFKALASYDKTTTSGYTAQGMGSDGKYIYFPVSSASSNLLEVYDWEGNKVADIYIATGEESESLFYVNDRYYVNFNVSGAQLYEVVFTAMLK